MLEKKKEIIENQPFISFISILIGTSITLGVLVLSKAIKFTPSEIIPVVGMVVSNSMVALSLAYKNNGYFYDGFINFFLCNDGNIFKL